MDWDIIAVVVRVVQIVMSILDKRQVTKKRPVSHKKKRANKKKYS